MNNKESTVLVIKNVDGDDQKEYRCIISNDKNTYSYKTFLHITGNKKNLNRKVFSLKKFDKIILF